MVHRRLLFTAILLALFQSTPSQALVKFDFEQKYFDEHPQPVLDHTLLEKDGIFHLFYLRGNPAVSIGHATSTDLIHWDLEEPVLSPGPNEHDNFALWAPYMFLHDGVYYMYYTGVNTFFAQRSALALSNDLVLWSKLSWPIYTPDTSWALWIPDGFSHGRDPHVIEHNGTYYMFVTAKTKYGKGAVGCASSTDLINWTDIGPIYTHYTWHVLESVFMRERNGLFHMFFTEEAVYGTSHMTSPDLLSGWDITNRKLIDLGHAAEICITSSGDEIFSRYNVHTDGSLNSLYTIRFDQLVWVNDMPIPTSPWPLAPDWRIIEGDAFSNQPTYGNNPYARGVSIPVTFEGRSWIGTYERYTGPMGYGFPGAVQGVERTGTLRSRTFTLTGYSMNLLVAGGNNPDSCYVAIVDANTGETLKSETGNDSDLFERRFWDLYDYRGREVYIDIVDHAIGPLGYINVDDIVESTDILGNHGPPGEGAGTTRDRPDNSLATTNLIVTKDALAQNTPNPFNPSTTIRYELSRPANASVMIYSVNGELVRRLAAGPQSAGAHSVTWNGDTETGATAVSGVYFCRLIVDGTTVATRKMHLLK